MALTRLRVNFYFSYFTTGDSTPPPPPALLTLPPPALPTPPYWSCFSLSFSVPAVHISHCGLGAPLGRVV